MITSSIFLESSVVIGKAADMYPLKNFQEILEILRILSVACFLRYRQDLGYSDLKLNRMGD